MGSKSKQKKRTKSQASPTSVDLVPEKRTATDRELREMAQSQPPVQTPVSPMPQSFLASIPPYPGNYQQSYSPVCNGLPSPTPQYNGNFNQLLLDKLDTMDKRLQKLDTIEQQLSFMSHKMTLMDNRVSSLELTLSDTNNKIRDIETSHEIDAKTRGDMISKQTSLDKQLKQERSNIESLSNDLSDVKSTNKDLNEQIIDLQSRSMRDNLLFHGIEECVSYEDRRSEDCATKILNLCENSLQIENATSSIKIDRAHRLGRFVRGKTRPTVAKFNFHQDKLNIKRKAYSVFTRDTQYGVSDQFPKVIQDRRKQLLPSYIDAKKHGKSASLVLDKLYIEGNMYTVDNIHLLTNSK